MQVDSAQGASGEVAQAPTPGPDMTEVWATLNAQATAREAEAKADNAGFEQRRVRGNQCAR